MLPNWKISLWPYSDLGCASVRLGKHLLRIQARPDSNKFNIGFPNPSGWLAYLLGNPLFVKYTRYQADACYFDSGSSSVCYYDERFLELESLGPSVSLRPGEFTKHVETWRLITGITFPNDETKCIENLYQSGLNLAGDER